MTIYNQRLGDHCALARASSPTREVSASFGARWKLDLYEITNGSLPTRPRPPLVALESLEIWQGKAHGVELITHCLRLRFPNGFTTRAVACYQVVYWARLRMLVFAIY